MIITRIDGGLGNQLFQYAYGYYLANQHSVPLLIDTCSYTNSPPHGYLLDRYCISATSLRTPDQQALVPRRYRSNRKPQGFTDWLGLRALRRHKESMFGFATEHLRVPDHRYLVGYWQSERFFPGVRESLLAEFQLAAPVSQTTQQLIEQVQACRSVAIHVRRGDYLTGAAASIYSHLELDYYQRAVADWAGNWQKVKAFVFSNDIAWCKQHLRLPCSVVYVDHNTATTAHEDMEIMRHAQCCVIANSTFSWWGAWLNQRPDKAVYAPSEWFRPGTHDDTHIIPAGWRRIPKTTTNREIAA